MKNLLRNEIDGKVFIADNCDVGLFSFSRDVYNSNEIDIIEKMIELGIINIKDYHLTDYDFTKEYLSNINYNSFKCYNTEPFRDINQKICAYNYLSSKYDISIKYNNKLFYIKELNLYINFHNQSISEFINLCMINDCNIGIIAPYGKAIPDKLGIRIINKKNIFNDIYNENSIFLSKESFKSNDLSFQQKTSPIKERHYLIRSYGLYRKQLLMDLDNYNKDKTKPKLNYNIADIDNMCRRFILKLIEDRKKKAL